VELFQVTIKRGEDIQAFYDDMETPGGALHIPERKIECSNRQPTSRTTGYMLTLEEAQQVSYDDRVEVVVPQSILDKQQLETQATYSGRFDKSNNVGGSLFTKSDGTNGITYTQVDHHSWGILRHFETSNRSGWGTDAATSSGRYVDDTVTYSASGRNVDIIIVDNHTWSDHAEFSDRIVDYNWGQHYNTITGGTNYTYTLDAARASRVGEEDGHPTAAASYAAGTRFGLAKHANVYNFSGRAEKELSGGDSTDRTFAYMREFHRTKPINPATGRKNPTIVSISLGTVNYYSGASFVHFQGTDLDKGDGSTFLTDAELLARGVMQTTDSAFTSNTNFYVNSPIPVSDLVDAIAEGIIVVTSGGNNNRYTDVEGGPNWDNYIVAGSAYVNKDYFFNGYYPFRDYYMRGDNFSYNGAINVGALSNLSDERKADFSNWGPGIDVYAAGEMVMGAQMTQSIAFGNPYYGQENNVGTWDTMGSQNGTSYAAPFIAGMIACLAEIYPTLTQAQATQWLQDNAVTGLMYDTADALNVDVNTRISIDGSDIDRIALWKNHRNVIGDLRDLTYGFDGRPASGAVYPRVKKLIKG